MLSILQSKYQGLRLTAAQIDDINTKVLVSSGEFSAISKPGTGRMTLTLKEPSLRNITPIIQGIGLQGGYGWSIPTPPNQMDVSTRNSAGTATNSLAYIAYIATTDPYTAISGLADVVNTNGYEPILYPLQITSAGVAQMGAPLVTVVKASSVFTVSFRDTFARAPFVFGTPVNAAAKGLAVDAAATANGCVFSTYQGGNNVPEDNSFMALVLGFRHKDESYLRRSPLWVPRRKPRITLIQYSQSALACVAGAGAEMFSTVRNSAGNVTFTYKTGQAPIAPGVVIMVGGGTRARLTAFPTTTGFTAVTSLGNGTDSDDDMYGWVVDFGDSNEFRRG